MNHRGSSGAQLKLLLSLTVVWWVLFPLSLHADDEGVIIHMRTTQTGMEGSDTGTRTVYYTPGAVRDESSKGVDSIILFNQEKFIMINHQKKTYTEMTFDEMEKMAKKAEEAANTPEQQKQREALRQMLGESGPPSVSELGPGEEIAGYKTKKYLVKIPPMIEMQAWTAPDLPVPNAYYDALKLQRASNPFFDVGAIMDVMKKLDGMQLKSETSVKFMNLSVKISNEAISVEKHMIPDGTFQPPADYTKTEETF